MFLGATDRTCPEVFENLRQESECGVPDVGAWATFYGVNGTWIQDEVSWIAEYWSKCPLRAREPIAGRSFVSNVFEDPTPEFRIAISIPSDYRAERAWYKWETLERYIRNTLKKNLDNYLEEYRLQVVRATSISEMSIPSELIMKFEVTALRIFRRRSPQRIAETPPYCHDRTVLHGWIQECAKLLDLASVIKQRRATK
jgi:hypothetical protein